MSRLNVLIKKKKYNLLKILNGILFALIFLTTASINISKLNELMDVNNNNYKIQLKDVPIISQLPNLPTGCEATAATMLLQWAGCNITKEDIANELPKGAKPYTNENGILIGGNPNNEFIGDPFSSSGFGVYHKPIYNIIEKYLPNNALDLTGKSFNEIFNSIKNNRPVIVWATIDNKTPRINSTWYDINGNEVVWKTPEHAMVLVGYTKSHVIVNDPLKGEQVYYDLPKFKSNWEYMGKQAVTVK